MKSGRQNGAKKGKAGGRGAKSQGAVGNTSKIPSSGGQVGDKSSNQMAKEVSALVAANQLLALGPSTIVKLVTEIFNASTTMGYAVARALVKKLMVSLPMDASSTVSATSWSPSGALMYLVWAAFTSLRKSGAFSNAAMVNAFPDFPAECYIPAAWAQFLAYLKPFRGVMMNGQFVDATFSALPTAPTVSGVGVGSNSFAVDSGDFFPRIATIAANTEAVFTAGTGTTWANLFPQAAFLSTVWARGVSCVPFDAIPEVAPDASAYAIVMNPPNGKMLGCFTPKFNAEVAYFYGSLVVANDQASSVYAYMRPFPVVSGNHSPEFWWVECFQMCAYIQGANLKDTLKTHEWNQARFAGSKSRYGRVRVHGRGGKKKQPVRFLFGNTIYLDTRSYQALISQVLQFSGLVLSDNQVAGLGIVFMSALIAKVIPYCYATSQPSCVPCGSYDPKFADAEMPLALAAVLNTVGPICADGRMRYPTLFSQNSVDLRGGWLRFSTVGTTSNVELLWSNMFGGTNYVGVQVPFSGTANFTYNAVNFATTTNAGATPLSSVDLMLESVAATFGAAANLVKPDSHNPVGKANMLVAADVSFPATANVGLIGTALTSKSVILSALGSFKRIAGDELGVAAVCPLVYPVDYLGTVSNVAACGFPFKSTGTGVNRTSNMTAYVQECASGTVSSSLSQALGTRRRTTYEVGGNTIDVSDNGDLFGAIVDGIVGPIFGDSAATFIKSGPLGTIGRAITGGPLLNPVGALNDTIGIIDGVVSSFGIPPEVVGKAAMTLGPMLL